MIYIVIPARYASSRFPGKPLAKILGKTMIQRVYEQALKSQLASSVIVATDDFKIAEHVESFGGKYIITREDHQTGTDRIAEVVEKIDDAQIIVNVQGDEPLICPKSIDMAIQAMLDNSNLEMSTLVRESFSDNEFTNPNIVKVAIDKDSYALYFSRSIIPFARNNDDLPYYIHIGLYVYRRNTLLQLSKLPMAAIEHKESLEQLRALYNGIKIKTVTTSYMPISVDSPDDIEKVEAVIES